MLIRRTLVQGAHDWIFGEAFSCVFFFGSKVIERVELWLLLWITGLELATLEVDFLPSFGDRGRVNGIFIVEFSGDRKP